MKVLVTAVAMLMLGAGSAAAFEGCGPGCHATVYGACVVDGWGTGAQVRNECPAGARPRPRCPADFVWNPQMRACFQR
ncbi:GCG_CRPN prefix-to-repeats domain-containing protein [Bradyrhizobium jicamae]|uniref:GCG_CRPN prefix-to-repeats domain-containing protein n=1 Tax=Bradyrhizobium jicamae TaxID=280332 RepID=UPI00390843AC